MAKFGPKYIKMNQNKCKIYKSMAKNGQKSVVLHRNFPEKEFARENAKVWVGI
jgi:hypothetical protein